MRAYSSESPLPACDARLAACCCRTRMCVAVFGIGMRSPMPACASVCRGAWHVNSVRRPESPFADLQVRHMVLSCSVVCREQAIPGSLSKESIGGRLTVVGLFPWCYQQLRSSYLMQGRNHGANHSVQAGFQSTYSIERPVCSEYVTGLGARLVILCPIILECSH